MTHLLVLLHQSLVACNTATRITLYKKYKFVIMHVRLLIAPHCNATVCVHVRKHSYTNDEGEADPDVELMPPVLAVAAITNNNSSSGKAVGSSVNSGSTSTAADADSMEEGSSLLEPLVGKTSDGDSSGAVPKSASSNVRYY
jgi:hypothetical protein